MGQTVAVVTTPTRACQANDLGERATIAIGDFGYVLAKRPYGQPSIKIRPQSATNPEAVYISSDTNLTMRDYDSFFRVVQTDWVQGSGQITFDPQSQNNRKRFYDSLNADIGYVEGAFTITRASASAYTGTATSSTASLLQAGPYLYKGGPARIEWSTSWGSAPATAATSAGTEVMSMAFDGQYVYGAVLTVGINRWAVNNTTAGSSWNTTSSNPLELIYANRRIYAVSAAVFYEVATASGTGTPNFTPPSGSAFQSLCALRGGAIDAPIILLMNTTSSGSASSVLYYWDGTSIHDFMSLPAGFHGRFIRQYLGVLYITGTELNPSGTDYMEVVYTVVNGTLGKLGYVGGIPQANGDPAMYLTTGFAVAPTFNGTFAYFAADFGVSTSHQVWVYDIANGGFSHLVTWGAPGAVNMRDIVFFNNGIWASFGGSVAGADRLYRQATTYNATASLDMSDLNLGQPWANNMWAKLELTFKPLAAGEAAAVSYSTDSGATYTTIDVSGATMSTSTLGAKTATWLISNYTSTTQSPYIRPRVTLTSGTSQLTAPLFYSLSIKAVPIDPTGVVIEAWLACPDQMLMPNGSGDWQGASGSERIKNIISLYESGDLTKVIYLAPNTTRAKNPVTISCRVDDYELWEYANVGVGPGTGPSFGVQGDILVKLRQVV